MFRRKKPTIEQNGHAAPPLKDMTLVEHEKRPWWARLRRAATIHMTPEKKVGSPPDFTRSMIAIITASWLNVLLLFIPVSWALHWALGDEKPVVVFVASFLAIIPLAKLMSFATEELAMRVGQTLGGLLNATLGNAVELIVAIIALTKCQLRIVQASLVGSILSNLLLVLGMCFFAGGMKFSEQGFGSSASQLNSSLLVVSVIAVLLPAAFHLAVTPTNSSETDPLTNAQEGSDILKFSRGVAIILLFTYGAYLVFQLYSHAHLYDDNTTDNFKSTRYPPHIHRSSKEKLQKEQKEQKGQPSTSQESDSRSSNTSPPSTIRTNGEPGVHFVGETSTNPTSPIQSEPTGSQQDSEKQTVASEEAETPQLSVWMCIILLVVVTVLVAVTAEFLVDSINGLVASTKVGQEWVGLILLPIVGNAAEHVTAVTVSVKDKLTLSLGVAAGSSIQIALFVIPFMVTLAWIMNKPLTLLFDPFESVTLFLAVLTVNYVTADGKTNWLEGLVLINLYLIVATTFWFYPGSDPSGVLDQCH